MTGKDAEAVFAIRKGWWARAVELVGEARAEQLAVLYG